MFIDWLGRLFEKIDRVAVIAGIIFIAGIIVIFIVGMTVLAM